MQYKGFVQTMVTPESHDCAHALPFATSPRDLPLTSGQLILPLDGAEPQFEVPVHRFLCQHFGPHVRLTFTQNRTTMISASRRNGYLHVRLHRVFAEAPEPVLNAITIFLRDPRTPRTTLKPIDDWLDAQEHHLSRNRPRKVVIQTEGQHHDLEPIRQDLNRRYFDQTITARITWSRATRGQKRRTMRLGSYCDRLGLIRIHPALDQAFVPRYFVASVVFHEMLHELHALPHTGKRRVVHSRAFLEDERQFEHYEKARRWERRHLKRLLNF